MIPVDYWMMRTIRRALPQGVIDYMLSHSIYLKPSWDTSDPQRHAQLYLERAAHHGISMTGKTVCVVGYGGRAGIGHALLELGAERVILQDPFAPIRRFNDPDYKGQGKLVLVHDHLDEIVRREGAFSDIVVSNSVLEHVQDLDVLLRACAGATRAGGINIHYIDLRDHYFKYPFEMLCYSESTWRRWLNASNHLNRLRIPDYQRSFERVFKTVDLEITERLLSDFQRTAPRIRREFLTGDDRIDAASLIRIEAT